MMQKKTTGKWIMTTIDLDQYDAPNIVLIGIAKILNEAILKGKNIDNVVYSDKPEIKRFINDCTASLS